MICQHCPQEPKPKAANILWTYDGVPVPVCWYHFHMLMMAVLGIGRFPAEQEIRETLAAQFRQNYLKSQMSRETAVGSNTK